MLTFLRSSSLVLVISSMSVHICNYFHARQDNNGLITTFKNGTPLWYPLAQPSLNVEGSDLNCWNLHSMLKISYANCFGLSPAILAQFTLELRVAARNPEKFTKTRYFEGSRSFNVIDVDISKKLYASGCYDKQHVCAYVQPFLR